MYNTRADRCVLRTFGALGKLLSTSDFKLLKDTWVRSTAWRHFRTHDSVYHALYFRLLRRCEAVDQCMRQLRSRSAALCKKLLCCSPRSLFAVLRDTSSAHTGMHAHTI
eukprot:6214800-Pleurochrysis_carterae.AAC.2